MDDRTALYIGGKWATPSSADKIEIVSPHTEEVIATVPDGAPADIDAAVLAAREAFIPWSRTPVAERIAVLERLATVYGKHIDEMADLITAEIGSPTSFSKMAQAPGPLMILGTFVDLARGYNWEETRAGVLGLDVTVLREAVGVVAAIVPWNAPQYLTMCKLAPALLAGCTVVLKPAPEAALDAFLLAEILDEAELPAGLVNIVPAGRETGEYLVRHPGIEKVSFTGSTAAGRHIASICGSDLKRCSLELGGKSAAIVLDDADLDSTLNGLKMASLANSGQACAVQTRILASRRRYAEVLDGVAAMVSGMKVGDPSDPATEIGPLVARRQQQRVDGYISLGRDEGARIVTGGNGRPEGLSRGWYVRPTVFGDVTNQMRIAREEIFGPVLTVIPYESVDDAIDIANDSEYGLAGSVWTADPEAGRDVARRVRVGTYGVNTYMPDFVAPFGGFKASGFGRELGREGIDQYTELKSIQAT